MSRKGEEVMKMSFDNDSESMRNFRAREEMRQDIISQMWDIWATFTFFGVVGMLEAEKRIRKFFDNINKSAGMQLVDRRINLFVCYEKHMDKEGVHIHAFIRGINPAHADIVQDLANKEIGNSLVKPYNQSENAAAYVSNKYKMPSYVDHDRLLTIHPKIYKPAINNPLVV
jgi:hypothetical protein